MAFAPLRWCQGVCCPTRSCGGNTGTPGGWSFGERCRRARALFLNPESKNRDEMSKPVAALHTDISDITALQELHNREIILHCAIKVTVPPFRSEPRQFHFTRFEFVTHARLLMSFPLGPGFEQKRPPRSIPLSTYIHPSFKYGIQSDIIELLPRKKKHAKYIPCAII